MYHITIGEKDMWGRGYGTEATQLMLDHAFGTLGPAPDRADGLRVQRARDPAYRRCGFVVEGRSREIHLARRPLVGRAVDERASRPSGTAPRRRAKARRALRGSQSPVVRRRASARR
jgi:hypothetical protein